MINEDNKAKSNKTLFGDNNLNRDMGTRRLNRMPLLILTVIGGIVTAAISYSFYLKSESSSSKRDSDKKPAPSSAANLLTNAPLAGLIDSDKTADDDSTDPSSALATKLKKPPPVPDVTPKIPEGLQKQLDDLMNKTNKMLETPPASPPAPVALAAPPSPPPLSDEEKRKIDIENARQQALMAAILANTTIAGGTGNTASVNGDSGDAGQTNPYSNNLDAGNSAATASSNNDKDPNKQQEKKDFLNQKSDGSSNYLQSSRVQPLSRYEIKAGTIIPSVMISGINSDIPGPVIGQVSENVYDTAKGDHILIPQGARLFGSFDNSVSSGQKRVMVVWHRIIFPDTSSLDIGAMSASDQEGYSGLNDQVDNHFLHTFSNAILLSVFSAAGQLSQPNTSNTTNANGTMSTSNSVQQALAASLGQSLSQLGTQAIQKGMDVAPTLIIRPGNKFVIIATKDMVLPPWKNK